MTGPDIPPTDDHVPVSVRLGEVVPPEDPEDWTRPLTWVAGLGMLAAPIVTLAWFLVSPPAQGVQALPATHGVAAALVAGAAATGATQLGAARAGTATLGAGLFAALVVVILGVVMAGERQVGVASPTLSHTFGATVGGTAGAVAGAATAALTASIWSRPVRFVLVATIALVVALFTVNAVMPVPARL